MSPLTQAEFDQLATFIAVAEELSMAHFCHPAFLKSALVPFRKLWLLSEACAFEKVRDLVFRTHPDQNELSGYRHWFYDTYSREFAQPADREWAKEPRRD